MIFFLYYFWYDKRFKKVVGGPMKVFELANNLKALGHKVFLFAPKMGYPDKQTSVKVIQVPVLNIPILRLIMYEFMLFFCSLYILLKNRCDIVYVRTMNSFIPLFISIFTSSPLIIEINDNPYRDYGQLKIGPNSNLKLLINRLIDKINFRFCNKICAVSDKVKQEMQKIDKISADKIAVIQSGANTDLFIPMDKNKCRLNIGLHPDKRYVGFVGNYTKSYDHDSIIDSAPIVIEQFPDVRFLIVGNGEWKAKMLPKINKRSLTEYFILCGYVLYKDVPKYICSMDVCLSPFTKSWGDSQSVKIFDCLSCGRPVVTNRFGSTADYLEEGNCIIFVPPEDPQRLAAAIIKLLSNPKKMEKMGSNGRKFIVERYRRKFVAEKVVEIAKKIGG